ncbi:MAG TPA: ATP-binding protein [Bryobacteraceae bacterium]|nr:ATP-binding protein [Bryobacteraceae bacterium]
MPTLASGSTASERRKTVKGTVRPAPPRPASRRYGYAVLAAALAVAARVLLDRFLGYHHPYVTFYIAVLWSAWYGGWRSGLLTMALDACAAVFLVLPTLRFIGALGEGNLVGIEFYFLVSLTGIFLFEAQRRAQRRSARNAELARERFLEIQKLESISLLAGGIAHDFNNLLTGILGNASLAKELFSPGSSGDRLLENVISGAERAAHLTSELLAYSGQGQIAITPLCLSELVRQAAGRIQPTIPNTVQLRLELADEMPSIRADRTQIQQLVTNLLLNSAEAIGARPGTITVGTGVRRFEIPEPLQTVAVGEIQPGEYVFLRVEDTGEGMNEATILRIFDPFFTTRFTGRGLGLASVSGIVRAHKGAIAVESAPGQGATFTVWFPCEE